MDFVGFMFLIREVVSPPSAMEICLPDLSLECILVLLELFLSRVGSASSSIDFDTQSI